MCEECAVYEFPIRHAREQCPFRAAAYCALCAVWGRHRTEECPDRPARGAVETVEQACPLDMLTAEYLRRPRGVGAGNWGVGVLEIEDSAKGIKKALVDAGLGGLVGRREANIRLLEDYAQTAGKRIVFRSPNRGAGSHGKATKNTAKAGKAGEVSKATEATDQEAPAALTALAAQAKDPRRVT